MGMGDDLARAVATGGASKASTPLASRAARTTGSASRECWCCLAMRARKPWALRSQAACLLVEQAVLLFVRIADPAFVCGNAWLAR